MEQKSWADGKVLKTLAMDGHQSYGMQAKHL
jgi:hypothetical protein